MPLLPGNNFHSTRYPVFPDSLQFEKFAGMANLYAHVGSHSYNFSLHLPCNHIVAHRDARSDDVQAGHCGGSGNIFEEAAN